MLTWDDLSPARKKWVRLVQLTHPEVTDRVSYAQIKQFHEEFMALREKGKQYKTAMALWLIGPNAISRGEYFFPADGNEPPELGADAIENHPFEAEYQEELRSYGIV